jgi:HEAT repeat protein
MHTATFNKLLKDINNEDASIRRLAVEALSEGDERAIYPLIKALRDNNFGVQDAAMRALMEIKGETTVYMVLPLLRENSFLRNTAMIILKEMGKIAIPLLYVLLNDKDDDVRKFALNLIHDIEYCSYPEKLVVMLTEDMNANVRAAAAKTIGRLQYINAVPQLILSLKDEEWVCFSALEALTELKNESSVDAIINLMGSKSETIRYAAIEALGKIGSLKAVKPLTDHVSEVADFEKQMAITSLIQIGSVPSLPGIIEVLIEMLMDDDWDIQSTAIKGIVALRAEKAICHMIDIAGSFDLSDPENEDKFYKIKEAVHSIGCCGSLIELLSDESVKYRGKVTAIEIIGDLACKDAVPVLIKLLNEDIRDIRRSSIESLGQINNKEAKHTLIQAINDDDSHVRKSAVTALGKIGEMAAFEPLVKMLKAEKYDDIIDECINSLTIISAPLFLSRINELNDNVQERALRYTSNMNPEATC